MTNAQLTPKASTTRLHILETGYQLVAQKGFTGIGLSEILKTAGVPKGSFYHYFASKEAFGAELLRYYNETYLERLETLLTPTGTGREKLLRYWQAWITDPDEPTRAGWAEGCLVVKLSAEVSGFSEDMRRVMNVGVEALIVRIAALILQGHSDGSVSAKLAPEATAHLMYQMWLGSALMARIEQSPSPMSRALVATEGLLT